MNQHKFQCDKIDTDHLNQWQCDQIDGIFVQYFDIINSENLPDCNLCQIGSKLCQRLNEPLKLALSF